MITSKDNDKLKLVRKLADRKHRAREGLFVTEGEDLLEAGRAANREPELLLTGEGEGLGGDEVAAELLDAASTLGSGTRVIAVWPVPPAERPGTTAMAVAEGRSVWVYLHGVGDPGNVGSIVRSTAALGGAGVILGPDCADPYGPKAIRASMGSIFAVAIGRGTVDETPRPRVALVARGGDDSPPADPKTVCLGAERDGLPRSVLEATDATWTIPMRTDAAESLGVAAAAAVALSRIGSPLGEERA